MIDDLKGKLYCVMKAKCDKNNDLVTIVVPAYNAETFLQENIESILNQTYKNIEVIYVCDGCTDNTVDI